MEKAPKIECILDRRVEKDEVQVEYYIKQKSSGKRNLENQYSWLKEGLVAKKLISKYNAMLVKDRDVELIIGATPTKCGNYFYVKWCNEQNGCWLPSDLVKEKYPHALIEFYEKNLYF